MLDESLDRLEHKLRAYLHQFVVHIACGVLRAYAAFVAHQDAAGVDVLVYHEGGHACELLPVDHGPVDGGRSPVLRQQGGVEIDGAEFRHGPHHLRQHAEGHHHDEVRLPGLERLEELRVLELLGLQQRKSVLHGVMLDCTFVHLQPASARLVGHGDHAHHLVFVAYEIVERCHREFRGAHVYDAHRAEEADNLALEPPLPGFELVQIEKF